MTAENQCRQGFSLIELLAVLAVASLLAGMVFALAGAVWRNARAARAQAQMETIADLLEIYRLEYAAYPDSLADLADRFPPRYAFDEHKLPLDPWNRPYRYATNSPHAYALLSYGPGGTNDTNRWIRFGY